MHDIDRTQMEYEPEVDAFEADTFEFTEEAALISDTEAESPFSEEEEMELASDLLEITDEAELDQFLGKLIKGAWRGVKKFAGSPVGRALGGILKGAAKKALPIVGGALGGPAGAALASKAGSLFGLELEGLSPEDKEFEVARRYVRFAGEAAKKAALAPPAVDPQSAAKAAVTAAARRHAPGLLPQPAPPAVGITGLSGRWIRRGRKIILLGV